MMHDRRLIIGERTTTTSGRIDHWAKNRKSTERQKMNSKFPSRQHHGCRVYCPRLRAGMEPCPFRARETAFRVECGMLYQPYCSVVTDNDEFNVSHWCRKFSLIALMASSPRKSIEMADRPPSRAAQVARIDKITCFLIPGKENCTSRVSISIKNSNFIVIVKDLA